jgi:hypothetical protein
VTCADQLGHENCGFVLTEVEHEGHKAAANAWERSRNKVYKRKIARQQGKLNSGPVMSFKKGRTR